MFSFPTLIKETLNWLAGPQYQWVLAEAGLPAVLHKRKVYLVEDDGFLEYAAMICPCGCNQTLYMNLIPDERPVWRATKHLFKRISMHPSIWRQKGCRSHFWLIRGRIRWCK